MARTYKKAESYKADFQKISKIFIAKVALSIASLIFVFSWFAYWAMK